MSQTLIFLGGLLLAAVSALAAGCGLIVGRMEHQAFAPQYVIDAADEQQIPDFSAIRHGSRLLVSVRPDIDLDAPKVFQIGLLVNCKKLQPLPEAAEVTQIRWTTLRGEVGQTESLLTEPLRIPIKERSGLGKGYLDAPLPYRAPAGVTAVDLSVDIELVYEDRRESKTYANRLYPFEVSFAVPLH